MFTFWMKQRGDERNPKERMKFSHGTILAVMVTIMIVCVFMFGYSFVQLLTLPMYNSNSTNNASVNGFEQLTTLAKHYLETNTTVPTPDDGSGNEGYVV